jgi:hypothetical protein
MICKCCVWCETIFLPTLLFLKIILEMPAVRSSVNTRRDQKLVGILCIGCTKVFKTSFSFDQHPHSVHLRGTACYSLPENTRSNLYAVKRHNMSTATLQETAFHRSRGCELRIQLILHIFTYDVYCRKMKSQSGPYHGGKARFEMIHFLNL